MTTADRVTRVRDIALWTVAITACAGPPAVGQVEPVTPAGVSQPNIYEVAPEQVAPRQEAQSVEEAGFIEVSGTGQVSVPPDRASVAFAMETRAGAADQAAAANADAMDRVLSAIRRADFPDLELETFGYSLQPEYAPRNDRTTREITSYAAYNNVRATTSDIEAVGRVIDTAISAGANRVASISFTASDTDDARAEALAQAVRRARAQAEVIARTLGHELGAALEVRGGAQIPSPIRGGFEMARTMNAQAAPTPIEAGDQTVTASVTIRFALGPELSGR